MDKGKVEAKYSLRGKRKGEESESKSTPQAKTSTTTTTNDESVVKEKKTRETIIFDRLIKEALNRPVEYFHLPCDYLSVQVNTRSQSNNKETKAQTNGEKLLGEILTNYIIEDNEKDPDNDTESPTDQLDGKKIEEKTTLVNHGDDDTKNESAEEEEEDGNGNGIANSKGCADRNNGRDIDLGSIQNNDHDYLGSTAGNRGGIKEESNIATTDEIQNLPKEDGEEDERMLEDDGKKDCNESKIEGELAGDDELETTSNHLHDEERESMVSTRSLSETQESCTSPISQINSFSNPFPGFTSKSETTVRGLFAFPDSCDLETQYVVLVQEDCVSIWWRESEKSNEWHLSCHKLEEEIKNLRCSAIETSQCIWVLLLFDGIKDLILVHLRFDKADKLIKTSLREFFSETNKCKSNIIIKICCLSNGKSVLSVPGPHNRIDIFLYDLSTSSKTLLTSLSAKNVSTCSLLPINDWDGTLLAHFDNRIYIWSIPDRSLITTVLTERFVLENKICFNVLYDKGLIYLFIGSSQSSAIKVIALNPKTRKHATLLRCNTSETDPTIPVKYTKLKRKGNQLIILRNDEVILFDLVNNKPILKLKEKSVRDASIGFISEKAVIFAATNDGRVINLLNS